MYSSFPKLSEGLNFNIPSKNLLKSIKFILIILLLSFLNEYFSLVNSFILLLSIEILSVIKSFSFPILIESYFSFPIVNKLFFTFSISFSLFNISLLLLSKFISLGSCIKLENSS